MLESHPDNTVESSALYSYHTVLCERGNVMQLNSVLAQDCRFFCFLVDHVKFGPPMRKETDPCPDLVRLNN